MPVQMQQRPQQPQGPGQVIQGARAPQQQPSMPLSSYLMGRQLSAPASYGAQMQGALGQMGAINLHNAQMANSRNQSNAFYRNEYDARDDLYGDRAAERTAMYGDRAQGRDAFYWNESDSRDDFYGNAGADRDARFMTTNRLVDLLGGSLGGAGGGLTGFHDTNSAQRASLPTSLPASTHAQLSGLPSGARVYGGATAPGVYRIPYGGDTSASTAGVYRTSGGPAGSAPLQAMMASRQQYPMLQPWSQLPPAPAPMGGAGGAAGLGASGPHTTAVTTNAIPRSQLTDAISALRGAPAELPPAQGIPATAGQGSELARQLGVNTTALNANAATNVDREVTANNSDLERQIAALRARLGLGNAAAQTGLNEDAARREQALLAPVIRSLSDLFV